MDKNKKEYITTDISMRKLSEKYSVSTSQIANHSRAEHWVELRKQYQNKIVTESLARQEEEDVDHLLKIKSAASKMAESIDALMSDDKQFRRHISTDKGLIVGEKVMKKYDSRAIREVTAALKDLSVTIRNMYDDQNGDDDEANTGVIEIGKAEKHDETKEIILEDGDNDV